MCHPKSILIPSRKLPKHQKYRNAILPHITFYAKLWNGSDHMWNDDDDGGSFLLVSYKMVSPVAFQMEKISDTLWKILI